MFLICYLIVTLFLITIGMVYAGSNDLYQKDAGAIFGIVAASLAWPMILTGLIISFPFICFYKLGAYFLR